MDRQEKVFKLTFPAYTSAQMLAMVNIQPGDKEIFGRDDLYYRTVDQRQQLIKICGRRNAPNDPRDHL